jgi:hypothetical protein
VNKKIMSYIVILCTIITVFLLLQLSKEQETRDNEGVRQEVKINKEQVKNINENKKVKEESNQIEEISKKTTDEKNTYEKKSAVKEDNVELNKEIKDNSGNSRSSINDVADEVKEEPVTTVFKVDKNTIINKLSVAEKMKLMNLSKKLSVIDYGRIKEYLESGEEYESAVAIFKILKSRLTSGEYKEIKDILIPYIDVEKIEKKL